MAAFVTRSEQEVQSLMPSDEIIARWHDAVTAHAKEQMRNGVPFWDVYIECFDASELKWQIAGELRYKNDKWLSLSGVKSELHKSLAARAEYEADIKAEAF
jgi:hypothetical protein